MKNKDLKAGFKEVRKLIKNTQRLQKKLESHLAEIDRLQARLDLPDKRKKKPN